MHMQPKFEVVNIFSVLGQLVFQQSLDKFREISAVISTQLSLISCHVMTYPELKSISGPTS